MNGWTVRNLMQNCLNYIYLSNAQLWRLEIKVRGQEETLQSDANANSLSRHFAEDNRSFKET